MKTLNEIKDGKLTINSNDYNTIVSKLVPTSKEWKAEDFGEMTINEFGVRIMHASKPQIVAGLPVKYNYPHYRLPKEISAILAKYVKKDIFGQCPLAGFIPDHISFSVIKQNQQQYIMKDFLKFSQLDGNNNPNGNFIYINKSQILRIDHYTQQETSVIYTTIAHIEGVGGELNSLYSNIKVLTKELEKQINLL